MLTAESVREGLEARDRRSLARVLTWLEAGDPRAQSVRMTAGPRSGASHTLGVTGSPGAGKSTLTNKLVAALRRERESVAVLAVDPSSPFSGGALLGDRIRMSEHMHDPEVFIRSMATRGQLGGLTQAVPGALRALATYGFDWLIVETVGVGQIEVDIADQADTTMVVVNPGWGDDVQASKAGLLEIADVFVVNKADRPGAGETVTELNNALDLSAARQWRPPVEMCVAESGDGVDAVLAAVRAHKSYLTAYGLLEERRRRVRVHELRSALRELAWNAADEVLNRDEYAELICEVAAGTAEPVAAARQLFMDFARQ
jgi:LAO/AO transport system kinase